MARTVSDEHKRAMQRGREMGASVDAYLKAVGKPKRRGRKVSVDEMRTRRDDALAEAETAEGVARLKLVQKATDLEQRIEAASADEVVDMAALEQAFVDVAAEYSDAQGISYSTWREVGVSAEVLKAAGIKQTRRRN